MAKVTTKKTNIVTPEKRMEVVPEEKVTKTENVSVIFTRPALFMGIEYQKGSTVNFPSAVADKLIKNGVATKC